MEHRATYPGLIPGSQQNENSLRKFVSRAILTWLLFIPVAFLNGVVREFAYRHIVGELRAHQISCVIASLAFIGLAYLLLHKHLSHLSTKVLWMTGALWILATMTFELILGYYINRVSWDTLFMDYNVFDGRLWILVLAIIFCTPVIIRAVKRRTQH